MIGCFILLRTRITSQTVSRAADTAPASVQDVRLDHCPPNVFVAQEFLTGGPAWGCHGSVSRANGQAASIVNSTRLTQPWHPKPRYPRHPASLSHVQRLRTNRLPDDNVRDHYKLRIDCVSIGGILSAERWMWSESEALFRTRDFSVLMELVNEFGEEVGFLPPLFIDIADECIVVVCDSFDTPR